MTAWMLFRGMPHRPVAEMTAVMPVVAAVLVALGWAGAVATANLALLEHALMMPAMLITMVLRLDLYRSRRPCDAFAARNQRTQFGVCSPGPYPRPSGNQASAWRAARIMRSSRSKPAP
jgi:hypothetical protein